MADDNKPVLLMRDIVRDPSLLADKRKELDRLRNEDNADWAQNREFYRGNQWVYWNDTAGRIETLGVNETQKPRYKVRLTANVLMPGVQQLVAQMTKTKPTIHAVPDSGADRDVKAAEMAERLYEYWWTELGLTSKLMSALTHAQISQGYWLITWDGLAGKSMSVMLDPHTGQPIWDDLLADGFKDDLRDVAQQLGMPANDLLQQYEKTVYVGDIRVQPLSGEQVWLDPSVQNFEDCAYAICKFPMTVDEIQARYNVTVTPDASTSENRPSLIYTGGKVEQRPRNVRDVFHLYHRPTAAMPKGRYVCWIEGPNQILYQEDWSFPFSKLPLVKFAGIERPGSVYDESRLTHGRPLQKELNLSISGIAMYKNMTMKPQMLAPVGSLRQRLTDEPGAVIEYAPIQGATPEWKPTPSLPAYVFEHVQQIQSRLDRLFNLMPTERSQLPARTDSGQLVELVQEAVADQISPEIQRMERALALAGELMVAYAQKFYAEPRLLKIKGPGGSVQVKKFLNSDLQGGFSFEAEAGSGLPRTRAGQVQQIKEMIEMGVLDPNEAVQYLPIAGLKGVQARIQADEELAHRRIEKLIHGQPINVQALQQALQQVQTGQNPDTGDFFQSPEEAQAFVEKAALSPLPYENYVASMTVIGDHMKSVEFESYPPDVQERFTNHYSQLQDIVFSMNMMSAAQPTRVTLGLNGTVGPTVAAAILRQHGVREATPDTMAEPPLETSVYDSIDKADADDAGNDPLTDQEKLLAIQQSAATHTLKMAKAQSEMAQATQNHGQQQVDTALQRVRAEELHQQKLQQAAQAHQQRMKQMRSTQKTGRS